MNLSGGEECPLDDCDEKLELTNSEQEKEGFAEWYRCDNHHRFKIYYYSEKHDNPRLYHKTWVPFEELSSGDA